MTDGLHLPPPRSCSQPEVDAGAVHRQVDARQGNLAVEQAASFEQVIGNILILRGKDRIAREDRVAVMPMVVQRVAAVCGLNPEVLGEELVLWTLRPIRMADRMSHV